MLGIHIYLFFTTPFIMLYLISYYRKIYYNYHDLTSILSNNDNILQSTNNNIPKYLFITHENINAIDKSMLINLKKKNHDWDIYFFTDNDRISFLKKYYPQYFYYYNLINNNYKAAKADFWRYIIIYHYGGIYIDSSVNVYTNLNDVILDQNKLIVTKHHTAGYACKYAWNNILYWNWFFAAPPKNIILKQLIETIIYNINNHHNYLPKISPHFGIYLSCYNTFILTGPIIFNKIISNYSKNYIHELEKNKIVYQKDKYEILYFLKYILFNKSKTYHRTNNYILNI